MTTAQRIDLTFSQRTCPAGRFGLPPPSRAWATTLVFLPPLTCCGLRDEDELGAGDEDRLAMGDERWWRHHESSDPYPARASGVSLSHTARRKAAGGRARERVRPPG